MKYYLIITLCLVVSLRVSSQLCCYEQLQESYELVYSNTLFEQAKYYIQDVVDFDSGNNWLIHESSDFTEHGCAKIEILDFNLNNEKVKLYFPNCDMDQDLETPSANPVFISGSTLLVSNNSRLVIAAPNNDVIIESNIIVEDNSSLVIMARNIELKRNSSTNYIRRRGELRMFSENDIIISNRDIYCGSDLNDPNICFENYVDNSKVKIVASGDVRLFGNLNFVRKKSLSKFDYFAKENLIMRGCLSDKKFADNYFNDGSEPQCIDIAHNFHGAELTSLNQICSQALNGAISVTRDTKINLDGTRIFDSIARLNKDNNHIVAYDYHGPVYCSKYSVLWEYDYDFFDPICPTGNCDGLDICSNISDAEVELREFVKSPLTNIDDLLISPNPTTSIITLSASAEELENSIQIFSTSGQFGIINNIPITNVNDTTREIDLSGLPNGVYAIKTKTQTQRIVLMK